MAGDLLVWRDGRVDGVLRERRGRLTFTYDPTATRPISLSMPVRRTAYGDRSARTWFAGLLPEGQIRLVIAYDVGVAAADDFGLLRELGRDCAGALSLRVVDDPPAADDQTGPALSDVEIGALLRALPTSPLGFDAGFRVSLPGNQHKLLLTRIGDVWHRPGGAPSTHILKPPIGTLGRTTVPNEAYCQWLAAAAGLPAARTNIARLDGVDVLVSERFDRETAADGSLRRVHQEDGCQALTIASRDKYEADAGGPSLRALAVVLAGSGVDLEGLLRQAVFAVAIGNADWHGKNVSVTFTDGDRVTVAPVYDAMCTRFYEASANGRTLARALGMKVGGEADIDAVRVAHLLDEARSWGLSTSRARRIVSETVDALQYALDQVDAPIEQLRDLIADRIARLV